MTSHPVPFDTNNLFKVVSKKMLPAPAVEALGRFAVVSAPGRIAPFALPGIISAMVVPL